MPIRTSSRPLTLGDLVAAAVDRAESTASNRRAAARLASRTVSQRLVRAGRTDLATLLQRCARELEDRRPDRVLAVEARAA